jgi:hypothetical protein
MRTSKKPINSISVQDRDLALLKELFESRVMAAEHIAALHFDGRKEAAKKRLQKLKAAGLISERKRRVNEPSVLFLARGGLNLLRGHGTLAEYPSLGLPALEKRARVSDLTLRHELEVMDVKGAFHTAMRKAEGFSIAEFNTWPLLNQFEAVRQDHGEVVVKPDGFIRIHENEADGGLSEHTFFLEVDRSSETLDTLVSKVSCYLDYYKSGSFAVRNGAARSAYKEYPFRVLMVLKSAERRNNIAEQLLQSTQPMFTQVCLSTLEEVTSDPLGSIWIRPLDYREAVKGTPFDSMQRHEQSGYQRQTARDLFVAQSVSGHPLLTEGNSK